MSLARARRRQGLVVDHQHEAAAIDPRRRPADHARKGVLGVALDAHHARHWQTGGIGAVDAGGDQAIVVVDVGVGRHEAQFEHAGGAAAEGDGAQAVAHHLYRNRLIAVGEQRHFRKQRMHARHLADDAGFIGHRAARAHAVRRAAVDEEAVRIGIAAVVHHLGGNDARFEPLDRADQPPQMRRLGLERLVALRAVRVGERLLAQALVLRDKLRLGGKKTSHGGNEIDRRSRRALQRIRGEGEPGPQPLGVAETRVDHEQCQR